MTARTTPVVLVGLLLAVLGTLFLADAQGAVDLRPALLWPGLLIAWGLSVLASALADDR